MRPILDRLRSGDILVGDGAMGTLLFQRGLQPGECPESVNLTSRHVLEEIAALYLDAGADIVQTNTFGGSPLKLAHYGLAEQVEQINSVAVARVRAAVGHRAYVSGSCGPSGEMLEPYGSVSEVTLAKAFDTQLSALIGAGVDLVCVETMTDLREAMLAVRASKSILPTIPVMATMTFDKIPKGYYTIMGASIGRAVEGLAAAGADIIGSNCGNGIDIMIEIAREIRQVSARPVVIQANAGLPRPTRDGIEYPESPAYFAEKTAELIEAGVSIIGGCCGTTPAHIRAIREAVDSRVRAAH